MTYLRVPSFVPSANPEGTVGELLTFIDINKETKIYYNGYTYDRYHMTQTNEIKKNLKHLN